MGSEITSRRAGWWRQSFHFLVRSLTLRATSFALALLAVTVGAPGAAIMLNHKADLGAKMSRELRRYGPNLLVTPADRAGASTLAESSVRQLPFERIAPLLIASGTVAGREGRPAVATVVGVDFEAMRRVNPSWRLDGRWPANDGASEALVGVTVAGMTGLAAGDRMRIHVAGVRKELIVAGVLSTGESEDDAVQIPLPVLQQCTGLAGRVSLAALSVDGGPESVALAAAAVENALPESTARPLRPIAAAQGAILGKLDRMMLLLTIVVLVLSGLCLTTTLMSIVLEREPEIGLMRSLGAGNGSILAIFLGEVSLLGLLGGSLGLILGLAGARLLGERLFDTAIDPRPDVILPVIAIALALCWTAVFVPLRRALAIQPAAALRGE